jgi:hypothetical protein
MKTKFYTLTIFFSLLLSVCAFAQPWNYVYDDYEGTDVLTTSSNVAIGPALKAVDLPYMNLSGGTPNLNLINTGGGWEGLNFYGQTDFYSLSHWDGNSLSFIHGTGAFNIQSPWTGPYFDKTLLTLSPNEVTVGDGSTNTKLQINGDVNFTGKFLRNGVELAAFPETIWTKDASNHINYALGSVGIGIPAPAYKLHVIGDIYANGGWLRVSGNQGLYFESHGGGFYMDDDIWIKTFNNKSFYQNTGILRTDGVFQVGSDGNRFLVAQNGNIGIGLTSVPAYKLDVAGDINYTGKLLKNGVEVTGGGSGSTWTKDASNNNISYMGGNVGIGFATPDSKLVIANNGSACSINEGAIGFNRNVREGTIFDNSKSAWQFSARDERFSLEGYNGATNSLFNVLKNGNVGLGTIEPSDKLTIDPQGYGGIGIGNPNKGSGGYTSLTLAISEKTNGFASIQAIKSAGSEWGTLSLNSAGGAVTIGTATPDDDAKLTVKGKIVASAILVKNIEEIPDYVFKTDYKLMPLHEVEQFVTINNHLPEVPSEKEFKENGINLTTMNTTLLKKVEELTLYLIEQNKKVVEMQKEIELLKKK